MRWITYTPWLLGWAFVFYYVPLVMQPALTRIMDIHEASETAKFFVWLAEFDGSYYYFPAIAILVAFVTTNEGVLYLLRRRPGGASWIWPWSVFVALGGLYLDWYLCGALFSQLFRMNK